MTSVLRWLGMWILGCSLLVPLIMLLPGFDRFLLLYMFAMEGLALLSVLLLLVSLVTPGVRRIGYAGAAGWTNPVFLLVMALFIDLLGFMVIGMTSR
jgi:hypothetical protein